VTNTITCRLCGRTIALSPATHLWWATDGSEPDCPHEPREEVGTVTGIDWD
jgi:hypothetical protein